MRDLLIVAVESIALSVSHVFSQLLVCMVSETTHICESHELWGRTPVTFLLTIRIRILARIGPSMAQAIVVLDWALKLSHLWRQISLHPSFQTIILWFCWVIHLQRLATFAEKISRWVFVGFLAASSRTYQLVHKFTKDSCHASLWDLAALTVSRVLVRFLSLNIRSREWISSPKRIEDVISNYRIYMIIPFFCFIAIFKLVLDPCS